MSQNPASRNHKAQHIATAVGLFVALVVPFLVDVVIKRSADDLSKPDRIVLILILDWTITLALLAIMLCWEREPLRSIGIRKTSGKDLLLAFGAFVIGAITFIVTGPLVQVLGLNTTSAGIERLAEVPFFLRLAIVLTAGITEEVMFRGYPIERLARLTGRLGWGALIAYLVFVLLHLPFWGLGGSLQIGVWTIVVILLYVRRRNLIACMVMHCLNDAYAFLLLPMFLPYMPR